MKATPYNDAGYQCGITKTVNFGEGIKWEPEEHSGNTTLTLIYLERDDGTIDHVKITPTVNLDPKYGPVTALIRIYDNAPRIAHLPDPAWKPPLRHQHGKFRQGLQRSLRAIRAFNPFGKNS